MSDWAHIEAVRKTARIINAEGGEPGNSLHSWRCEYPAWSPCDCVDDLATEIVATVAPLIRADERERTLLENGRGVVIALEDAARWAERVAARLVEVICEQQTALEVWERVVDELTGGEQR